LEVGSTLKIQKDEFRVQGIFETSLALLQGGAVLEFSTAQRIAGMENKINAALIYLEPFSPELVHAMAEHLESEFAEVEATAPAEFSQAFDEFDLAEEAVTVFSILAMLVGGIGVMNTMLMSVFERTREIGILQAIGWSKLLVLRQVLLEAAVVCLLAGPLGIAMGVAGVEIMSSVAEISWISGTYDVELFLIAFVIALGMGLVGTVYPAWRAVQITPIEALRYE
jgi:putative ABC transport system permease protein